MPDEFRPQAIAAAPSAAPSATSRGADARRALVGVWSYWRAERAQWRDPGALRAWQARRLRVLVRHACATVPFYRRLYAQERVDPAAIRSLADLAHLPVITKAQLQAEREDDLLSETRRKEALVTAITSGSAGRPFRTWRDLGLEERRAGYLLRALATAGYRLGDRLLMVVESGERPGTGWTRWRKLTFHDRPDFVLAEIDRLRPKVLYGYVSALRQVARLARERGHAVHRPSSVVTVSETLDPDTRQELATTFGAPVFDIYGSIEMGVIAWECGARPGFHLAEDSMIAETLPAVGGGARLVLTNLHNMAMPLIRYDQGDLTELDDAACPCGRRFRRLTAVQGRVMDAILRPDGSQVSPFQVTTAVRGAPGVRRFQIVQERPGALTARIESAAPLTAPTIAGIEAALRQALGPGTAVSCEQVASLEPPPGVKFRLIESRIPRAGRP
ncbi:MAG: hypothetical protein U1E52_21470 [Geminicoccaceae bacterium]